MEITSVLQGRILFVDDEEKLILALMRLLKDKIEPPPLTALSGKEALSILNRHEIDIMVTDIRMPQIDGIELISLARQIQPNLECIVLTGFGKVENAAQAMRTGAVDYLEKPCNIKQLLESLSRTMERVRVSRASYERLLEQNEKLKAAVYSTLQPIINLDNDGRISLVNSAAKHLFQMENEQMLGKSFHRLVHHTKQDGTLFEESDCPFCIAVKKGEPISRNGEILRRADKSAFIASVSMMPIIENGQKKGASVAIQDQSELERWKSLALEYKERDTVLNEHLPTGVVWLDAVTHTIVDANASALKLLQGTSQQLIGLTCHALLCENGDGNCPVTDRKKTVINQKTKLRDLNGRLIPVLKTISQVTVSGRNLLLESFIDISAQEQATKNLRSLNDSFHAIVSRTCDGILIIDSQGFVQFANPAALSLFGLEHDDMVGKMFGYPSSSGEPIELDLVNSGGHRIIAEMRIADTTWKGEKAYIANLHDISVRKKLEGYAQYHANHDPLTGLPNRNLFRDRLQQLIMLAKRYDKVVAILFVDLDGFKLVNDTYGHNHGDDVLQVTAERLKKVLRASDTIARIGGDEFLLALRDVAESESIEKICRNIKQAINEPIVLNGKAVSLGCSIGISIYPKDGDDMDTLIKNADTAMYVVKEGSKNNYAFFS